MTTTDIDALKALEQAATAAPWAHEHEGGHIVHGPDSTVAEAMYAPDAALIAAMRNALPALLDELAQERWLRENAGKVCDNAVAATHEIAGQRDAALSERDAAREELAKTRAELDATHTELERLRGVIREGVDMAEWHRNEVTTWKRKAAKLREQLGNAKARISAAATVEVWTNEDGKRFVFADDLMRALDPNPEANPATTAEPTDDDQDGESLFESHRLADGTMPNTIPVTDPEQDAPDGATIDGYTRQRDTWVKDAEPAAS